MRSAQAGRCVLKQYDGMGASGNAPDTVFMVEILTGAGPKANSENTTLDLQPFLPSCNPEGRKLQSRFPTKNRDHEDMAK